MFCYHKPHLVARGECACLIELRTGDPAALDAVAKKHLRATTRQITGTFKKAE